MLVTRSSRLYDRLLVHAEPGVSPWDELPERLSRYLLSRSLFLPDCTIERRTEMNWQQQHTLGLGPLARVIFSQLIEHPDKPAAYCHSMVAYSVGPRPASEVWQRGDIGLQRIIRHKGIHLGELTPIGGDAVVVSAAEEMDLLVRAEEFDTRREASALAMALNLGPAPLGLIARPAIS